MGNEAVDRRLEAVGSDGSDLWAKVFPGELVELFWAVRGTLEEMSGHLLRIRESQLSKEEMGALMLKAAHWSEPGRQYATDETYAVRAEELLGVCRERMRARAKEAAEAMAALGGTGECCYCGGGLYESDGHHAACVDCRGERAAEENIPPTPLRRGTDTDLVDEADEADGVDLGGLIDRDKGTPEEYGLTGGPVGNAAPTVAEGITDFSTEPVRRGL